MAIDILPDLVDILMRWEESRERGHPLTPEELCRDCPDRLEAVRRRIRSLERLDGCFLPDPVTVDPGSATSGAADDDQGDASLSASNPLVQTRSDYRVLRVQAKGGLGAIFVAHDVRLGRDVALKRIRRASERDPARVRRFVREAEITSRLEHPGIVPVYGAGEDPAGQPCYIMRLIHGETLQVAIVRFHDEDTPGRDPGERALAFRQLLSRLTTVCQAVAYAHSQGVIHRDLKPSNIMLGPYQETLVVDWGLAKQLDVDEDQLPIAGLPAEVEADDPRTRLGSTLGTPAYMSPEQAAGAWDRVGPRSDVYSLGAILYGILTGKSPFPASSATELLKRVEKGVFPAPGEVKPGVPRTLAAVCLKAMALRLEDRYASAADLAAELEHWLADEAVSACQEPTSARLGRWVRRHKPAVTGAAALLVTAVVALGLSTAFIVREQRRTERARMEAVASFQRAQRTLSDMQAAAGLVAAGQGKPGLAALWFTIAAESARDDPQRARINRVRSRAWGHELPLPIRVFPNPGMRPTDLAFHPGGGYLLARGDIEDCAIWDIDRERLYRPASGPAHANVAAWNPQGDRLALGTTRGEVFLFAFPDGRQLDRIAAVGPVTALAFGPRGRHLAIAATGVRIWDCDSMRPVGRDRAHPRPVNRLVFSARGDRLVTACEDGHARVFAITSGVDRGEPLAGPLPHVGRQGRYENPISPAFANRDRILITVVDNATVAAFDPDTGRELGRHSPDLSWIGDLKVNAAGTLVAVSGNVGIEFLEAKPELPRTRRLEGREFMSLAFGAEDHTLLSGSYRHAARFWSLEGDGTSNADWPHQGAVDCVAVTADGRRFATAQRDGLVRVWDAPRPDPRLHRNRAEGAPNHLAAAPDGRHVMPTGFNISSGPAATRVYDVQTGRAGLILPVLGVLHGGTFSPDGRHAVTLSSPADESGGVEELRYTAGRRRGLVRIWDWRRGVQVIDPILMPAEPIGATYRPDGRVLVVACATGAILGLDPVDGRVLFQASHGGSSRPSNYPLEAVRFAPDGRSFATCGLGTEVKVWDAGTGVPRFGPLRHDGRWPCPSARFSPDGLYLVTASFDGTVRVWDAHDGRSAGPPLTHANWVFSATFSPDGEQILTGCRDGFARLWDWRRSRLSCAPLEHNDQVPDVHFSADGRFLITASHEGAVRVWDRAGGKLLVPPLRFFGPVIQVAVGRGGELAACGWPPGLLFGHLPDLDRPDRRLPDGLDERAFDELLAGLAVHSAGTPVSLTSAQWLERWSSYRVLLDRGALRNRSPNEADAEAPPPSSSSPAFEPGLGPGRWAREVVELDAMVARRPDDPMLRYQQALFALAAKDSAGFRRAASASIAWFAETTETSVAHRVAHACVAGPDGAPDPERLVRLAGRAVPDFPGNERILGAALYRAGRPGEALVQFERSAQFREPVYWDLAFLALIHHRLGHADMARDHARRAERWIADAERPGNGPDESTRPAWYDYLLEIEAHILLDEVHRELGSGASAAPARRP